MRAKKRPHFNIVPDDPGYTLIEVLIAMAVFSIGILAVFSMQLSAVNNNSKARNSTTVLTIAKGRVEELIELPFDHADLVGAPAPGSVHAPPADADSIDNNGDGRVDEVGEAGPIRITWRVIDDQPLPGNKSVRVTAVRSATGRQRTATLDFIKIDM